MICGIKRGFYKVLMLVLSAGAHTGPLSEEEAGLAYEPLNIK